MIVSHTRGDRPFFHKNCGGLFLFDTMKTMDTSAITENLKKGGFSAEQSNTLAVLIVDPRYHAATKSDLQIEVGKLRSEMRFAVTLVIGIILAAFKFFPN